MQQKNNEEILDVICSNKNNDTNLNVNTHNKGNYKPM